MADCEMVKKICLIAPGLLPVPATGGGAIETLMTSLAKENEEFDSAEMTVISPYEEKAHLDSSGYKNTRFIYISKTGILGKALNKVSCAVHRLMDNTGNYGMSAFYNKALKRLKKLDATEHFDAVVFEGGPCDALTPYSRQFGNRLMYHLHYNPDKSFHSTGYSRIIAVSEFVAQSWRKNCLDPLSDVVVVHNGINLSRFQKDVSAAERREIRSRLGFDEDDFVLLYCGRIIEVKGVLELLKAVRRIDDGHVKLMIVGSPDFAKSSRTPYLDKVQHLVDDLGNRVVFTGYVPNEDVYRYSKSADLQVVPSLWEDAAPTVCMEGMAAGLPLLVTRSGGIQEYTTTECAITVEKDENVIGRLAREISRLSKNQAMLFAMSKAALLRSDQFTEKFFYHAFVDAVSE